MNEFLHIELWLGVIHPECGLLVLGWDGMRGRTNDHSFSYRLLFDYGSPPPSRQALW